MEKIKKLDRIEESGKATLEELLIPGKLTRRVMQQRDINKPCDPTPYVAASVFIAQAIPYLTIGYGVGYGLVEITRNFF